LLYFFNETVRIVLRYITISDVAQIALLAILHLLSHLLAVTILLGKRVLVIHFVNRNPKIFNFQSNAFTLI